MEFGGSPLSCGKEGEEAETAYKRQTRRSLIVIAVSLVILTALIVFAVVTFLGRKQNAESEPNSSKLVLSEPTMLKRICNVTRYSEKCHATLSSVNSTDPKAFFGVSLIVAMEEHLKIFGYPRKLISSTADESIKMGLKVCDEMIVDAMEYLNETIGYFDRVGKALTMAEIEHVRGKLSFVIVDYETCFEVFEETLESDFKVYQRNLKLIKNLKDSMKNATEFVSNSLAIVTRILGELAKVNDTFSHRRLLGLQETELEFPGWLISGDRRFLLEDSNPIPNVTVAIDGSGNFRTINEAIAAVPEKSNSRFLIYVKKGIYVENVVLPKNKWNILMYGDGNTKTIVSGSRNKADDTTLSTFKTATFLVEGKSFMAKDMKFINTAGPEKHQAVAFRSKSDRSVLYRCAFVGYQDTLYAHAGVQFYRDCVIVGSVDFICGHAAAVFQNCDILPRQPLPDQFDTVTAHGSLDPYAKSGFSIIKSRILPFDGDNFTAVTYLGRPWKSWSTTVVMKSLIGSLVDPAGWIAWNVTAGPPKTLYYGEYNNYGSGSGVAKRVKWVGCRPNMTDTEAQQFTVTTFINGKEWLNKSGVPYDDSM